MNGLKITLVQGETIDRRQEYFFDHRKSTIVIGCDPEVCDIAFPEQYKDIGIGNEHLGFKRSLGRYQIDLNTDHYVSIDGDTPFEDQEISGAATVQLGESVVIRIEVIDERKPPVRKRGMNPQPGEQIKKTKKYLLISFVIILGLAVAGVYFNGHLIDLESNVQVSDENIRRVTDRLKDLSFTLDTVEKEADSIARETIDTISRSVYLVLIRNSSGGERPAGTAWVIAGGRLATNAHVAALTEDLAPDEELVVRSPVAPYRTHAVKDVLVHPGYESYLEIWNDYLPCQKVGTILKAFRTIQPADVAILYPEDAEQLNPPLPLANMEELSAIEPGMKVAFVGYPSESLLPGNNKKPAPVAQQDEVIRITDFFQTRQSESPNRLIHHGLPITGGASGSPMFNSDGKVIGIVSSMNINSLFGSRSPNAADVNFGQRIDFLFDLMGQNLDDRLVGLETQWRQSIEEYLPGVEASNQAVLDSAAKIFSVQGPEFKAGASGPIDWGDAPESGVEIDEEISLDNPGLYLVRLASKNKTKKFTVYPPGNKNITVYSPKIEFSDYAQYAFVLAGEPGSVAVELKFIKRDKETVNNYQLDLAYWQGGLDSLMDSFVRYAVTTLEEACDITLLKKVEQLPMTKEINGLFLTAFEVELEKKGVYVFTSVSQAGGELNISLRDETGKTVERDKSKNGIGLVTLDTQKDNSRIEFISYSSDKGVVQNMAVYSLKQ